MYKALSMRKRKPKNIMIMHVQQIENTFDAKRKHFPNHHTPTVYPTHPACVCVLREARSMHNILSCFASNEPTSNNLHSAATICIEP